MKINDLKKIFGSKTKAQEIFLLLKDVKPVVRQGFYDYELNKVEDFCKKNNFYLKKSNFKIKLDEIKNGFSNKGIRLKKNENGMYYVYISKNELKTILAKEFEEKNDNLNLGLTLGYPRCCINFFIKSFKEYLTDLEIPSTNPYTNLSQRKNDCVILSHFPCSPECDVSIKLAKKYYNIIKEHDPKRAFEIKQILKMQ